MMVFKKTPYLNYTIKIDKKVEKFIQTLPKPDRIYYLDQIDILITDKYEELDIIRLQGFKNLYRIKIGDYRIIFKPLDEKKILLIAMMAHRKEVYSFVKNLSIH